MHPIVATKLALNLITGLGVMKIVDGIVKNNVVVVTTAEKVMVTAGKAALGSILVEQTTNYVNVTVDRLVDWHENKDEDAAGTNQKIKKEVKPAESA